jgi:hypothetical protein
MAWTDQGQSDAEGWTPPRPGAVSASSGLAAAVWRIAIGGLVGGVHKTSISAATAAGWYRSRSCWPDS